MDKYEVRVIATVYVSAPNRDGAIAFVDQLIEDEALTMQDADIECEEITNEH